MTKKDKPDKTEALEKEKGVEEEKETARDVVETKPAEKTFKPRRGSHSRPYEKEVVEWIPRTDLGKEVMNGKYESLDKLLAEGKVILEPEIVDHLVPEIKQEIIYIGGSPGKGGGIRRTATRISTRMHKSGRRYTSTSIVIVGNGDGIVGAGHASSKEHRTAIEKAVKEAKLNMFRIKRGCGSWECGCGTDHSIPFKVQAKHGSVVVTLLPAPKGVGMVADNESKKILTLAGIKDIWVKTRGQTNTRMNLAYAVIGALKGLTQVKGD